MFLPMHRNIDVGYVALADQSAPKVFRPVVAMHFDETSTNVNIGTLYVLDNNGNVIPASAYLPKQYSMNEIKIESTRS